MLFPARCASCDASGAWPLCKGCTDRVGVVTPPWCERCGRPWEEPLAECPDCPPRMIDRSRAPFLYDGPIAEAIKAMKFGGAHALTAHFAAAIVEVCSGAEADVVTWVPLSRRRRSRRGFDQAELLARGVGARLDIPVEKLLIRTREVSSQARRSGVDRRAALRGAFRSSGRRAPRRVVLVDDVLTTGSTAAECAAALKQAGAELVDLATAARSLGGPVPERTRFLA